MKLNFLRNEVFRTGQLYSLVEANQIHQPAHEALVDVFSNPDVFGLFLPVNSGSNRSPKVAYKDVALLYYHFLQGEGPLPHFIRNTYDDQTNQTLARLILDGILEINSNGTFVSGAAAQTALYKENTQHSGSEARLPRISERAIRYVLKLNNLDTRSIATRLYCYNTAPAGKTDYKKITSIAAVEKYLGIPALEQRKQLTGWKKQGPTQKFSWLSWYNLTRKESLPPANQPTYKIYISPSVEALPVIFGQFVSFLPEIPATSFKVGASLEGLLRPDKLMVYFTNRHDMEQAAQILQDNLTCSDIQGVPFTCPIDAGGLLSWGIDPPQTEIFKSIEGGSWRAQVTDKIAIAVGQAQAENIQGQNALDFITKKLSLLGVNPSDWTPAQQLA